MVRCYILTMLLALCGVLFNEFSLNSLVAFVFVSISAAPLLFCGLGLPEMRGCFSTGDRALAWIRAVTFALALACPYVIVVRNGYSLLDLRDFENVLAIAANSTLERYAFEVSYGNPLLVAAAIINAFLWPTARLPLYVSMPLALLPAAMYSVLTTEKWPLYCALSFSVTALMVVSRERAVKAVGSDYLRIGTVVVVGILVGAVSLAIRRGASDADSAFDTIGITTYTLAHYVFAQYDAFGGWLMDHFLDCCTLGANSFVGPLSFVGVAERAQGVFTDVVVIGGIETNIYTAWRFLVQDFSFAGPFAIVLLFAVTYRYCVLRSSTRAAWFMLVMLMFTTFLQPNTTLFVHNSITLAALLCAAITARYIRPVKI